jgi:hypothetical protein
VTACGLLGSLAPNASGSGLAVAAIIIPAPHRALPGLWNWGWRAAGTASSAGRWRA